MKYRFSVIFIILVVLIVIFNAGYLLGQSPWAPFHAFSFNCPFRASW